jgi:zinc transport system substrate-binding protein
MSPRLRSLFLSTALLACATPALALDGVVASIKPVHSLVAAVMGETGEPRLIVSGSGSEHIHSLRPSDAKALEAAKVVFWVGDKMETFLTEPLKTLSGGARVVALSQAPGLELLDLREGGPFEAHDHSHEGHDHEGHNHDDHAHEGHSHHAHDHAHGEKDMHFWLDPVNAKAMLVEIQKTLSEADPENAEAYAANARAYADKLDALVADIEVEIEDVREKPSIVFHDAYQYFEKRFGVNVAGSITVSPEVTPGAQRLTEIRERVKAVGAACIFAEPQFEPKLVSVVAEGTDARTGVLDPLGAEIADGPQLYLQLIRNLATSLKQCLAG